MHYGKNEVLAEYRLEIKYVKLKTIMKKMIANNADTTVHILADYNNRCIGINKLQYDINH